MKQISTNYSLILLIKTKTEITPLLRSRHSSLMLLLYAFLGKQAHRQNPPATSSPILGTT